MISFGSVGQPDGMELAKAPSGLDEDQRRLIERKRQFDHRLNGFVHGRNLLSPPRSSMYGVCFVMPLVSKQLGWPPALIGHVVQSYIVLLTCWILQGLFIYEIYHIDQIRAKDCDADPQACFDAGYVTISQASFPDYTKWMLCENADVPHVTRLLCISVFVVSNFSDLRVVFDMLKVLMNAPSKGDWLIGKVSEDVVCKNHNGRFYQITEEGHELGFQVAGIDAVWAGVHAAVLVVPKFILFLLLIVSGTCYLFNEADRIELILNAVAFCFVQQIDQLLFIACVSSGIREKMDNMQGYSADDRDKKKSRSLAPQLVQLPAPLSERTSDESETESDSDRESMAMMMSPFGEGQASTPRISFGETGVKHAKNYSVRDYLGGIMPRAMVPVTIVLTVVLLEGYLSYKCTLKTSGAATNTATTS